MHVQKLSFPKYIFVRFDGKISSKMDESGNFLNVDNPYVIERRRVHQFLSKS